MKVSRGVQGASNSLADLAPAKVGSRGSLTGRSASTPPNIGGNRGSTAGRGRAMSLPSSSPYKKTEPVKKTELDTSTSHSKKELQEDQADEGGIEVDATGKKRGNSGNSRTTEWRKKVGQ